MFKRLTNRIINIVCLMRVNQWIKNFFVYVALIFSLNLTDWLLLGKATIAFLAFCLLSSGVYIFNDINDLNQDRNHPKKKNRPLAAGRINIKPAVFLCILLIILGLYIGWKLSLIFLVVILVYLVNNILYTLLLKKIVILDVMSIALGFFLRVYAGAVVIDVKASNWLLIAAALLALFLALGKRRYELLSLSPSSRRVLEQYDVKFIDQMIAAITATILLSYALYTVSPETVSRFGTDSLLFTLPWVIYGIFRYLYLLHLQEEGGDPTELLYKDKPLLICVLSWVLFVIILIYR
ncbi:decaprenyl-phosphate phosphoribosyltransferase [Syntrophomonas curvata]